MDDIEDYQRILSSLFDPAVIEFMKMDIANQYKRLEKFTGTAAAK